MRTKLEIVKHSNGLIEMRVANRHVCLFENISMPEAMAKARAYASERPTLDSTSPASKESEHEAQGRDTELNLDRMVRSATAGSAGEPYCSLIVDCLWQTKLDGHDARRYRKVLGRRGQV